MIRTHCFILCLSGMLVLALGGPPPAAAGSNDPDYRREAQSYRTESRLRITRDHHQGRSFTEQRSRLRNPSYLRREEQRRALSEGVAERSRPLTDLPNASGGPVCRTMTSVESIEERRALVSQRECFDASGITHVSPGSRRVIKYYDE